MSIPSITPDKMAIEISGLNFFYGTTRSLRDVNLGIRDKKVTAFIGPSGCGKSTLLRTLNRMYELYPGQRAEGKIMYNGKNIWKLRKTLICCAPKWGWCFKNRHLSLCRCTTTSLSVCACTKICLRARWTNGSNGP